MNVRPLDSFQTRDAEHHKRKVVMNDVSGAGEQTLEDVGLFNYKCKYCGNFIMILGAKIDLLPRRSTDNSIVINRKKHVKRIRLGEGKVVKLKRAKGWERQYRLTCGRCGLDVGYRAEKSTKSRLLYVLDGALTNKATVLHVEGSDQIKAKPDALVIHVPKSITKGSDSDSVKIMVRATHGAEHSRVSDMNDKVVEVQLRASAAESAINQELRRYFAAVLGKTREDVSLEWTPDEDVNCLEITKTSCHMVARLLGAEFEAFKASEAGAAAAKPEDPPQKKRQRV